MKCTKCGADCDPKQLFCLRCGTPVNSNSNEENKIKEVEVPIEDMIDLISLDDDEDDDDIDLIIGRDLSRANRNVNHNSNIDNSLTVQVPVSELRKTSNQSFVSRNNTSQRVQQEQRRSLNNNPDIESDDSEENSKKKYIIIGSVIGGIVLVAIVISIFVFGSFGKYDEYYANGVNLYNKNKLSAAATQFKKAADTARKDEDKIEADVMLWKVYSQLDGYENELVDVLLDLISLEPGNASYYEALIVVYQGQDNQAAIDELIASVTDETLKEQLKNFDGTTPVATIAEGNYDKPISVGLTAASGSTIYYTVNGGNASTSSEVYTTSLDFSEEGTYILKAIAVDSNGKKSKQFQAKYILQFATVNPPVINLDNGTYGERKKVEVTADAGCTVYYTTNGSIPTKDSKKYEKPFKIAEKNTIYQFVAIDEKGVSSDVVTRVYNFERVYKYSYNDAVKAISSVLVSKGIMEDEFGFYEDGSAMYFEYTSLEKIDKEYYYIITATKEDENGKTVSTQTYAYGADNARSYSAKFSGGTYSLSEIE